MDWLDGLYSLCLNRVDSCNPPRLLNKPRSIADPNPGDRPPYYLATLAGQTAELVPTQSACNRFFATSELAIASDTR